MRVLLIEDEKKVAAFISKGLKEKRFSVDVAGTGEEGEELALQGDYDLIILDLMLPDKDGLTVCKNIRKNKKRIPVLILSAKDALRDKVKGLDAGADDYLVKPFAFSELIARVRALIRRNLSLSEENELQVGDLRLNLINHRCYKNKNEIELTSTEYKILEYFMSNPGKIMTRTDLYEKVWDINFDTNTNLVDVYINRLKKKIDQGRKFSYFRAVRGSGYIFYEK